jgi:hypothetical protein
MRVKNIIKYFQSRKLALFIALIYVGFGTVSVCSVYPSDRFYAGWAELGLLVTFPICFISFSYRYTESELLYPVFIIQLVMFVITFLILCPLIKGRKTNLQGKLIDKPI